jgi:hypothetical protein
MIKPPDGGDGRLAGNMEEENEQDVEYTTAVFRISETFFRRIARLPYNLK